MAKCSFCGIEIPRGRGTLFIKEDAKSFWFCSSKCEKNMLQLKRKSRKTSWTSEGQSVKKAAIIAAKKTETPRK